MAKQSPTDPKFRCNICKEYYYAPEHMVHYQCPDHGYLCNQHVFKKENMIYYLHSRNNPNSSKNGSDPSKDPYYDMLFDIPSNYLDTCKMKFGSQYDFDTRGDAYKSSTELTQKGFNSKKFEEKLDEVFFQYKPCGKHLAKFTWNVNVKRWLEEGKEKEEDFIKENKVKTTSKSDKSEIKLLVDLFEKNILTKEQFLEQIKNII